MKIMHGMVAGAAVMAFATAAFAESAPGWYLGGAAGLNAPAVREITDPTGGTERIKFKYGFAIAVTGGYKWSRGLRTELELSYGDAHAKNIGDRSQPLSGKQADLSAMGNLLWDFSNGSNFTPYIGAGIGYAKLRWDDIGPQTTGPGTTTGVHFGGSSSKLTWQGIAGVAYSVSPQTEITLDYRYKGSGTHSYSGNVPGLISGYKARTHRVMLGVRIALGAPEEKAAPVAAAAPPPPPPPAARPAPPPPPAAEAKFLVFFDFDRSALRADAQKVIAQAVEQAKKTGKARITTTGHADTSGTPAYNLALSERRANAVRAEVARLGIGANQVTVRFRGESEPLVQTGDGVKEPQNRRVEIVLE